ncbi:MAG: S-layer homology domain-containing protein [Oscillospiraceae bacterium]|nr:S-layer homology domain-containing protein [Oscillospiraceae bacterium]
MKRRLISLLLALTLLFSISAAALAVDDIRETDFFEDREHTDLSFSDLEYKPFDLEAFNAKCDEVRKLLEDAKNADEVTKQVLSLSEDVRMASTLYNLIYVKAGQDVNNDELSQTQEDASVLATKAYDGLLVLIKEIIASPCLPALDDLIPEDELEDYANYTPVTEEQLEMEREENTLVSKYRKLSNRNYSATYNKKTWHESELVDAYYAGKINYNQYRKIYELCAIARANSVGPVYMELMNLHKKQAATYEYDDYAVFAYEQIYVRGEFTPSDSEEFSNSIQEYLVPVYKALDEYCQDQGQLKNPPTYTSEEALKLIGTNMAKLSSELYESHNYMLTHNMYDVGPGRSKTQGAYTTYFSAYGAPFLFSEEDSGFSALSTMIHESGHYNNFYWQAPIWTGESKSTDISEVHSQGLELLFTHWYNDYYKWDAEKAKNLVIDNILYAIVTGAAIDELERFAYSFEGELTVTDMNEKWAEICYRYGLYDSPQEEGYEWVNVNHIFEVPFYYISYAISAAGAFPFWIESAYDYFGAVDDYLRFVSLERLYDIEESFTDAGMDFKLDRGHIWDLSKRLVKMLKLDSGLSPVHDIVYTDVGEEDWFKAAVDRVTELDLMPPADPEAFMPNERATRGLVADALFRLNGDVFYEVPEYTFKDVQHGQKYAQAIYWAQENEIVKGYTSTVFGADNAVTREQTATILYRISGEKASEASLERFKDAERVSAYAREAMAWAVEKGIFNGTEEGYLFPRNYITRAQLAQVMSNYMDMKAA